MLHNPKICELFLKEQKGEKVILPWKIEHRDNYDEKEILKTFGIKFLERINESYQYAELPNRWQRKYYELLDEKNTERAQIKQCFDVPVLKIMSRYEVHAVDEKSKTLIINGDDYTVENYIEIFTINAYGVIITINAFDSDTKKIIFSTEVNYVRQSKSWQGWQQPQLIEDEVKKYWKAVNDAEERVKQWLDNNFPEWRNPGAYWNKVD